MKKYIILLMMLMLTSVEASIINDAVFFGDVEIGGWAAVSGLTGVATNGGSFVTGEVHTISYQLGGTNRLGRLPFTSSTNIVFTGVSDTNAVKLNWTFYTESLQKVIIRRSTDGESTWAWLALSPTVTTFTDTSNQTWQTSDITAVALIGAGTYPWAASSDFTTLSNDFTTLSNYFDSVSNDYTITSNYFGILSNSFASVSNSFLILSNYFDAVSNDYTITSNYVNDVVTTQANNQAVIDAAFLKDGTRDMVGNILFGTDNVFDIGASGANRPRSIYIADVLDVGGKAGFSNNVTIAGAATVGGGALIQGDEQDALVVSGDCATDTIIVLDVQATNSAGSGDYLQRWGDSADAEEAYLTGSGVMNIDGHFQLRGGSGQYKVDRLFGDNANFNFYTTAADGNLHISSDGHLNIGLHGSGTYTNPSVRIYSQGNATADMTISNDNVDIGGNLSIGGMASVIDMNDYDITDLQYLTGYTFGSGTPTITLDGTGKGNQLLGTFSEFTDTQISLSGFGNKIAGTFLDTLGKQMYVDCSGGGAIIRGAAVSAIITNTGPGAVVQIFDTVSGTVEYTLVSGGAGITLTEGNSTNTAKGSILLGPGTLADDFSIMASGSGYIAGMFRAKTYTTISSDDTGTLSANECKGTLLINGDDDAFDRTLPTAEAGLTVTFGNHLYDQVITVDANTGDKIILNDGTVLDAGDSADSDGSKTDKGTFVALDDEYWLLISEQNTWVDGGP